VRADAEPNAVWKLFQPIAYLKAVWRLHPFWLAMVRNDLRSRYRRSVIGIGWSLLHPIAMTAVLCTVFAKMFHSDVYEYAPFLLAGLTLWSFITTVMNGGCQCFIQSESYIRQHPAPLAIYPLRTVLGAGFHFLLGLAVTLGLVWYVRGFANLAYLPALLPTLALLLVFGWSLAVCAGMLNVLFQDCQHLVEVFLQIAFYVTPIMYKADLLRERHLGWLVSLNPVAVFLEMLRRPILEGRLPPLEAACAATAATLVMLAAAALALSWAQRRMIFYL
jgi:lipopolysaccharide transport system permease protein